MAGPISVNDPRAPRNPETPPAGNTPTKKAALVAGVAAFKARQQVKAGQQAAPQNVGLIDPLVCTDRDKSPRLTEAQLREVKAAAAKSTVDGWRALAKFGDRYAGASVAALSEPTSIPYKVMHNAVKAAGADTKSAAFQKAAKDHLKHYIADIEKSSNNGGTYRLPTSTQIEESYARSLQENGISPYANTALLFARTAYADGVHKSGDTWHDCANGFGINLEADRKGPPSKAALGLDYDLASKRLKLLEILTGFDMMNRYPKL